MKYIKPPNRKDCKWRRDTPQEPGWYPASRDRSSDEIRYWNGERWSVALYDFCDITVVAHYAAIAADHQNEIWWCKPWWITSNKGGKK